MPIVLALLLAAKAAHAKRQKDESNDNSDTTATATIRRTKMKTAQLERRGAYMLDVKNGRMSLPPENDDSKNSSSSSRPQSLNESNTNDNEALSSQELTSTMMGLPVDLDDVQNTSFETVNMSPGHKQQNETTFRNDVRNEWVDAMFGRDFFPLDENTTNGTSRGDLTIKQGVGGANVGTWVTYGALLDPTNGSAENYTNNNNNSPEVKSTPRRDSALSTLLKTKSTPLLSTNSVSSFGGSLLNVRSSSNLNSESNTMMNGGNKRKIGATISRIPLGVYVKSISVSSEGYTVGIRPGSILIDVNGLGLLGETSHRALERLWRYAGTFDNSSSSLKAQQPMKLRFYKDSKVYSVLLLSANPLEGIEWAPCGNFGLVQRSHGLAAQCGVRRGSLVLAVNGVGLRRLDHAGVARELIENYAEGQGSVVLTCGYTPATSRSGYYEEKAVEKKNGGGSAGVEVRPRPVEYSTAFSETFFACTTPSMALVNEGGMGAPNSVVKSKNGGDCEKVVATELAAYVAAGGVLPSDLGSVASQLGMYESTQQQRRRIAGNGSCGPCPAIEAELLLDAWDPLVSLTQSMSFQASGCCEDSENYGENAAHSTEDCLRVISEIAQHPSSEVAESVFDSHLMQLLGVASYALLGKEDAPEIKHSEKLLDILVDVALKDINLCQRLFFLIRCFIGVLDGQTTDEATKSLRLLRYAQRRLSGRMFDKSESHDANRLCSEGYPMIRETSSTSSFSRKVAQLDIALSESSLENRDVITPGAPANRQRQGAFPSQEANCAMQTLRLDKSPSGDCLSVDTISCQTPASSTTANSNDTKKKNKLKSSIKIRQLLKGGKSKSSAKKLTDSSQLPPSTGITRTLRQGSSFSFTNVFHKQSASLRTTSDCTSLSTSQAPITISMSQKFDNLAWILRRIDSTCSEIEQKLVKSFPQKMADLALRPWSASKESALASITQSFHAELREMNSDSEDSHFPILNPIDSSEHLTSVDTDECFILPSAHFPMLLCFNSSTPSASSKNCALRSSDDGQHNVLYRTKVEILQLRSTMPSRQKANGSGEAYIVQGAVGGMVQESGASELFINPNRSSQREVISHRWTKGNTLSFETISNSGHPKTLSLKISTTSRNVDTRDDISGEEDMGCAFVDLTPLWNQTKQTSNQSTTSSRVFLFDERGELFDQHGLPERPIHDDERIDIEIKVSVEVLPAAMHPQKRLLLYKHGDDMRQELLAIQFVDRCNQILVASGLDLKLKTFRCLPVGAQKGFIEWISGTVPLSQLCQSTSTESNVGSRQSSLSKESLDESRHCAPAGAEAVDSINAHAQGRSWCKYQAIRGLGQSYSGPHHNPIQDFLRSAAFDEASPYYIKKDVMDTYIKSCAGYCVITYLLGVGDRHLDNILLHTNGHLLHCDFSFILGNDPKTYLPMRITEEMIRGFGGQDSDNWAKFLSFTGAAFLTLRRHNSIHSLLSQMRNMVYSNIRDLSVPQPVDAILDMRKRFKLELNDDDALTYIEHLVEKSTTSRMWRAVDAMHSLGKKF